MHGKPVLVNLYNLTLISIGEKEVGFEQARVVRKSKVATTRKSRWEGRRRRRGSLVITRELQ